MSKRGWALFLTMSVIWGVPYLLIRIAVEDVDPLVVAFGRTLIGALILLPIALHTRALVPALRRWKPLLLYTAGEISAPWLLLGHAETRLTSSTAGLLIAVVPLIAAVIVTKLGHDRFNARRLFGLIIGFVGVAALVGLDIHLSDLVAVGAVALTALGYAIGPVIISRSLADVPPMGVITGSLIIAAAGYAPFAPLFWPARITADAALSVLAWASSALLPHLWSSSHSSPKGPARATLITYINPAVALLLGVIVLSEPLTIGMMIGFPLVIVGSILGAARVRESPMSTETLIGDRVADEIPAQKATPITEGRHVERRGTR
jgi:drug/metabolite transporter (DMT)-like permease